MSYLDSYILKIFRHINLIKTETFAVLAIESYELLDNWSSLEYLGYSFLSSLSNLDALGLEPLKKVMNFIITYLTESYLPQTRVKKKRAKLLPCIVIATLSTTYQKNINFCHIVKQKIVIIIAVIIVPRFIDNIF